MYRRVVITAFEASPNAGTEAGLAWQWAKAYMKRGFSVIVITNTQQTPNQMKEWTQLGATMIVSPKSSLVRAPETMIHFVSAAHQYRAWRRFTEKKLDQMNLGTGDLLHHVSWGSARLRQPLAARGLECKTVWGPLGGGQAPVVRGLPLRAYIQEALRLASFSLALINRPVFWNRSRPDLCLATNTATLRLLRARGFKSLSLMLADGVPSSLVGSSASKSLRPIVLLWAGRLVPTKRADLALRICHEVQKSRPVELLVAGAGPEMQRLKSLRTKLDIQVLFLGKVPWADMGAIYDKANFLLFHSMRDSSCPSVLEAASRGLPSVGLRVSGAGDLVPKNVLFGPHRYFIRRRFTKDCAEIIIRLSNSPEEYSSATYSAIEFAHKNVWDSKVSKILEYLERNETT